MVAALAAVVLAGCSDPKAGTLPTPSPTTVAPTTATPTPSTSPGADVTRAVANYYEVLEQASKAPSTGADTVAALIAPGCPCARVVEFLREEGRQGHRIERPVELRDMRVTADARGGGTVFAVLVENPGRVLDASGRVVERLPARTSEVVVDVVRNGTRLLIAQISVTAGGAGS